MTGKNEISLDFNSPQGAILMWDQAIAAKNINDVAKVMNFKKESVSDGKSRPIIEISNNFDISQQDRQNHLEQEFNTKGFEIFSRKDIQFTDSRPHFTLNIDGNKQKQFLQIERIALMQYGADCLETFIVGESNDGWRVLERSNIEIHWNHPSLGDLEFDNQLWQCPKKLPCIDREIQVFFEADERGPTANQIAMLGKLINYSKDLWVPITEYLLPIYQKKIYGSFTFFDDEDNDRAKQITPKIDRPQELVNLFRPPIELTIAEIDDSSAQIEFDLRVSCAWDMENGINFHFVDWKIDSKKSFS